MAKILTRSNKVGSVLKKELWTEDRYCRKNVSVDTTTAGADKMDIGTVLYQNDKTGDYIELADAFEPTLDNIAILIDEQVQDVADGGTATLAVLHRGPAVVAGITYGAATDSGAEAIAALEALGIAVETRL